MLQSRLLQHLARSSKRCIPAMNLEHSALNANVLADQIRSITTRQSTGLSQKQVHEVAQRHALHLFSTSNSRLFSTSTETNKPGQEERPPTLEEMKKMSTINMFKAMFKQYSWVFLFVYFGLYLIVLGLIFALVQSGKTFSANDILDLIKRWGLLSDGMQERINYFNETGYDWALNFGAAWVATKFTEPLRLILTFFITPKSAEIIKKIRGQGARKALFLPLLAILPQEADQEQKKMRDLQQMFASKRQ